MDEVTRASGPVSSAEKRKHRKSKSAKKSSRSRSKSASPDRITLKPSSSGLSGDEQPSVAFRKRYDDNDDARRRLNKDNESTTDNSLLDGGRSNFFKDVDLPPGSFVASSRSGSMKEGEKRMKSSRSSQSGSPNLTSTETRFRDMGSAFRTLEERASNRRLSLAEAAGLNATATRGRPERGRLIRRSASQSPPPQIDCRSDRAATIGDPSQTDPELRDLDRRLAHRLRGRSNSVPSIRNMLLNTDVNVITRKAKELEEQLLEEKEAQEELRKATVEHRASGNSSSSGNGRRSVGRITRRSSLKCQSRSPSRDSLDDRESKAKISVSPEHERTESKRMAASSRMTPFGGYRPEGSTSTTRSADVDVVSEQANDERLPSKSQDKGTLDSSSQSTLSQRIVQRAAQLRDGAGQKRERPDRRNRIFRRRSRSTSGSSRASAESAMIAV